MPSAKVTVTFRVPKLLNQNLKAYSVQYDTSQNEVAVKAITDFLREQGVNVDAKPRFFERPRGGRQPAPQAS
jgi:phage-related protein